MVVIPELSAGTYNLEIVTQFTDSSMLKQPRTALLDKPLTVE